MLRLSLGSWSSCLRMYSQSFLVTSVRGSGSLPTTAASAASGCTGLLRAFLAEAAFFGVGIGQLERARLGSQAKNQPCLSGSLRGVRTRNGPLTTYCDRTSLRFNRADAHPRSIRERTPWCRPDSPPIRHAGVSAL